MIKQFLRFSFLTIIIAGLFGGCAVGQKYHYDNVIGDLYASGNKTIGVVTQDKRPYILSGEKNINFVGIMRGSYGNPFNVVTESGQPLVDDMTQSICLSLSKKGFKPIPVNAFPNDSFESILGKLKTTKADNFILLTLYQWWSDFVGFVVFNSWLDYNATLKVLDRNGEFLTEKTIKNIDDLGKSSEPVGHSKKAVPETFKKKIEELLNDPEVVKSLQQ